MRLQNLKPNGKHRLTHRYATYCLMWIESVWEHEGVPLNLVIWRQDRKWLFPGISLAWEIFTPCDKTSSVASQFSSVKSLSHVWLFVTPWIVACQSSLSITNSQSPPKPMSIESVMPSNHLILCHPLLLLPSIFPSIRVFSNESALCIRWAKYWSFSFSISPSNEHPGLISFSLRAH